MNDSSYQAMASSDATRQQWQLDPAGQLSYWPAWLEHRAATQYFEAFERELAWQQRPIILFGRQVLQPRLTAFYGDAGIAYRYSGKTLLAEGWPAPLAAVRDALETDLGERFNSVLCNLYRDGSDGMGWHADNEPELGNNPLIASVSLGSRRRFRLKPSSGDRRLVLDPAHGSLIVMAGDIQHHWLHEVPKTRRVVGPRINLTFRRIRSNTTGRN